MLVYFLSALFVALGGCRSEASGPVESTVDDTRETSRQTRIRRLNISFDRTTLIPTSKLSFELLGSSRIVVNKANVTFDGVIGKRRFNKTFDAKIERKRDVGNVTINLPVKSTLFSATDKSNTIYSGSIQIELNNNSGTVARGTLKDQHLSLSKSLKPSFQQLDIQTVHPNEQLTLSGTGVLRPSEGTTWAVIESGTVNPDGGARRDIGGKKIPVKWLGKRNEGGLYIDPGVFGVQTGSFEMSFTFENELKSGRVISGPQTLHLSANIRKPELNKITPKKASRGQFIDLQGKGFVPRSEEDNSFMVFEFDGTFQPDRSENPRAASLPFEETSKKDIPPTEVVTHSLARQNIFYKVTDRRKLKGLGSAPGVFEGQITPVLHGNWGTQRGISWEGTFEVQPTKQIVYLKYLPAFSKGLEKYGIRRIEPQIRDQVMEVVSKDFGAYNVEFRESKPRDFSDYAVIEIGGPDPTGSRHFGYDNSFNEVAKDTGNLHLNDYLGGVSAASAKEFNAPYGGIFINSFSIFSKQLNPSQTHASKVFDNVLGPFMPKLGGEPIEQGEWPDGQRSYEIQLAIKMVGNVIGNTITHEIGHSLGMTFVPMDRQGKPGPPFHNQSCAPSEKPCRYIMDGGANRPFEERAQMGSKGAIFNERNRKYLRQILPKPGQ
jgi:hypothetical protein